MVTNRILIFGILLLSIFCSSQNPNGYDTAWVNSYGGGGIEKGRDIIETQDHGFILVGNTETFGNGNISGYIIKTDSLGKHQWSKAIGVNGICCIYSIDLSSNSSYFISGFMNNQNTKSYDGFISKIDSVGNILWLKNFGGESWDFFFNSCLMPDGGLILCGRTESKTIGGADGFIVRVDYKGDTIWTKKIGGTGDDTFNSVEQKGNSIYVVGKSFNTINNVYNATLYKLNFAGNIINKEIYSKNNYENTVFNDLCFSSSGEILICGSRKITSDTSEHCILRKIDTTSLNELNYLTSPQFLRLNSIVEGNNGDIYTVGLTDGGLGGLAAQFLRLDNGLTFAIAGGKFGGTSDENGYKIIRTSKGYAFVGITNSYGNMNGSREDNVYLVIFNKKDLVNEYFLLINQFEDNLSPVSLQKLSIPKMEICAFPNPANLTLNFILQNLQYEAEALSINIYNQYSELVRREKLLVTDNQATFYRYELNPGLYFYTIKAQNDEIISSGKVIFE